jgi:methyl-accepting chemotaxis protein
MKKLTFQQKLWIPLICSLLCITVIFVYNALEIRKIRIEERSADLSNAADLGLGAVKMFGDLRQRRPDEGRGAKAGHGRHQSMRRRDRLSSIINLDAVVVMNRRAANEWQEHVGFQAITARYLYRDIVAVGKSDAGKGFVHYYFPVPARRTPNRR